MPGDIARLYPAHAAALRAAAEEALAAAGFDALVLHSGTPFVYFADDQEAPFRTNPPFAHWLPLPGPHHLLLVRPRKKPLLVRVKPGDFWREADAVSDPFWAEEFDLREVPDVEAAWKELHLSGRMAYVGDSPHEAREHGFADDALNPRRVISHLEWRRSFKTSYEIACLEEANHLAGHAHEAAREEFLDGASELGVHYAYVDELGVVDAELPSETVTAMDEKAAILHYQGKRTVEKGKTFLLDAGASYLGYASDIARTVVFEDECDFLFRGLLGGMEELQQELCRMAVPGVPFPELHRAAHVKIGDLLHEFGILTLSGEDAAARGLTRAFFPHAVSHFIGIQVHDVGSNLSGPDGSAVPAPSDLPKMRMTRTIAEGNAFTVEPGLYFIDMLLRPHRSGDTARYFDWQLVDRLAPYGGIRIEDDLVATGNGSTNLTRLFLR